MASSKVGILKVCYNFHTLWLRNFSHTYGLPILKYVIRWKPVEFEMFEQVEVSPTQNTFILNNLSTSTFLTYS